MTSTSTHRIIDGVNFGIIKKFYQYCVRRKSFCSDILTLIRAKGLGNVMFLSESDSPVAIPCCNSVHNDLRMGFGRENKSRRSDVRGAQNTEFLLNELDERT